MDFVQFIGDIGDFAGVIAVVVTLSYSVFRFRSSRTKDSISFNQKFTNTKPKRLSHWFQQDFLDTLIDNKRVNQIYFDGFETPEAITVEEQQLVHSMMLRGMINLNKDYEFYLEGKLTEDDWHDSLRIIQTAYVERDTFCTWWEGSGRNTFGSKWRNFIDSRINESRDNDAV
jgi:hypothetical protein